MHDLLFENQNSTFEDEDIIQYATTLAWMPGRVMSADFLSGAHTVTCAG